MTDTELNVLKTDVALINKDIKQIEKVFDKVSDTIEDISQLHKVAAVQETILENTDRRLTHMEESFIKHAEEEKVFRNDLNKNLAEIKEDAQKQRERRHKEVLQAMQEMSTSINEKFEVQEKRIRALENWRWWILGASAGLVFVLTKYNSFMSFFG